MTSSENLTANSMEETSEIPKTPAAVKQEEIALDSNDSDCMLVEVNDPEKNSDDSVSNKEQIDEIIELDKDDKPVNGHDDETVVVFDLDKKSQDLENEISNLTSIVRDEIDINLDSAELEILDERVENSLNAELENVEENCTNDSNKVTKKLEENDNSKTSKESKLTSDQKNTTNLNNDDLKKNKLSEATKKSLSKSDERSNLWICNISTETRANDLKQIFGKYAKVVGAKIVVSTRTPGSKCYGYVTVESEKDADNCIANLNNTELHNCKIQVDKVGNEHEASRIRQRVSQLTSASNAKGKDKDKDKEKGKDKEKNRTSEKKVASTRKSLSSIRDLSNNNNINNNNNNSKEKTKWKGKTYEEWQQEIAHERERLTRLEERMRRDLSERQKQMERRIRDEERRLERDREELRHDREKLDREKAEMWRLEREKARLERERLEREKEELRRQKNLMEEEAKRSAIKRIPSPPTIRKDNSIRRGVDRDRDRDHHREEPTQSKRRYDSSLNDYDRGPPSKLPPNPIHNQASYESEAAAYIARMDRESRQHDHLSNINRAPKDLRYTLMESASYRNNPMDMPSSSSVATSNDRNKGRDHRFIDDSPKDHRQYDRSGRATSPPSMKFNPMPNNSPANWRNPTNLGPVPPSKRSSPPVDSMRWMSGSNASNNRINNNAPSMYTPNPNVRSGQSPLMMQSPWVSQIGPPGTDFNVHNMNPPTGNYGMPPFDNYKGSSLTRNKY